MPFNTDVSLTAGLKLLLQRALPGRILPTITLTTTAIVAIGATSIPVSAVVPALGLGSVVGDVLVQQGDKVTFNSTVPTTITVTKDVKAGDSFVDCLPTLTAIQSGNIGISNGYLLLLGADDASFKIGDKIISTRGFDSGIFDENVKVMLSAEMSVSGFYRVGDPCIKQIVEPASLTLGTEIAWKLVYPNGQYRSGFGLVQGFEDSNKLDDIRKYKFSLKCNGSFQTGTIA